MARELTVGGVSLRRGTVLELAERDYAYGEGPVRLVVRAPLRVVHAAGEDWVELTADEVLWNAATRPRLVQVRVAALAGAVRNAGGAPG